MMEIPLNNGLHAIVDDEDYEELSKHKWHAVGGRYTYYAARNLSVKESHSRGTVLMHRAILNNVDSSFDVDHKDGNGLNNTRRNLRAATPSQNGMNRKAWGKSKYIGVSRHKASRGIKWRATICLNKQCIHIGLFDDEASAAAAYDRKAKDLHGDFAKINFE
jgi:hypothetical protein